MGVSLRRSRCVKASVFITDRTDASASERSAVSAEGAHERRARLRAARNRAALSYTEHHAVPEHVDALLREHLIGVRLAPQRVLDLGPGGGDGAPALRAQYPGALVVHADPAVRLLRTRQSQAPRRLLARVLRARQSLPAAAEAHQLPFIDAGFELVLSNLGLSLNEDLPKTLHELRRVMCPGGLLAFSILGPDSFTELHGAWRQVDGHEHVPRFPDMHDVGDLLLGAGFADVVMDSTRLTVEYPSVPALLAELRALGITNVLPGARPGLTTAGHLARLESAYARTAAGKVPVTLEVACAHAWMPERAGTVSVALTPSSRG